MEPHARSHKTLPLRLPCEDVHPCGAGVLRGLIRILALFTLIELICVTVAHAQPALRVPVSSSISVLDSVAQPTAAWIRFCEQAPRECQVDTAEPRAIVLTAEIWNLVSTTNAWVNGSVRPMTDQDHWGDPDRWDYPTDGIGDCEDFQLLKRRLLVAAGLPRRALRMTVVLDETGAGHAVLTMRTNRGDFILDNKVDAVLPWHRTGYEFIKREGAEGTAWVALGHYGAASDTARP